jgi:hypothetical protein
MKGKVNKLDDLRKVFSQLTDAQQEEILKMSKKLLAIQKNNKTVSIAEGKNIITHPTVKNRKSK